MHENNIVYITNICMVMPLTSESEAIKRKRHRERLYYVNYIIFAMITLEDNYFGIIYNTRQNSKLLLTVNCMHACRLEQRVTPPACTLRPSTCAMRDTTEYRSRISNILNQRKKPFCCPTNPLDEADG